MIRISRKADYAIFIMTHLARQGCADGDASMSAQELAAHIQLSKAVVANLLKDLARAGLLTSIRGVHGGYSLARPSQEISLLSILEAVEGPFSLVECAHDRPVEEEPAPEEESAEDCSCSLSSICPSRGPLQVLHDRIVGLMQDLNLAELGEHSTGHLLSAVGAIPDFGISADSKHPSRQPATNTKSPQTPESKDLR
ncbi:MAG: RrF2 family transcriptional regulator [Planctomycetota bacterium]|jgi:Rrf2 family protein